MSQDNELIFVYNADSGGVNAIKDSLNKLLRPNTYKCSLCSLTHNFLGEARAWKRFKANFSGTLRFYHKDEFIKEFASKWLPKYEFPIVLIKEREELVIFISTQELADISNLDVLISQIKNRLKTSG